MAEDISPEVLAQHFFERVTTNTLGIRSGRSLIAGGAISTVTEVVTFVIDGAGVAITTGVKGDLYIPYAHTITAATALADQSGSIVVDVWRDSYANFPPIDGDSVTASAPVTITTATKSQDTTLTGWLTSGAAGSIYRFNVDSATAITRLTVALTISRSL